MNEHIRKEDTDIYSLVTAVTAMVRPNNHGRCGGGFGGGSSGGGASAAAETKQLGFYDERPAEVLEAARRETTLKPRPWWGLGTEWRPALATEEGESVYSIARERKTKRAQWLRDTHSFEPGAIPRPIPL